MAAVLLSEFLAQAARKRFAWGEHDCVLFAADWVLALTGLDPAARYRGTYATEDEADALLASLGGIGMLARDTLMPMGWRPLLCHRRGDLVVVSAPTRRGKRLVMGLCAGKERIALLTIRGLVVAPCDALLAWRHGERS